MATARIKSPTLSASPTHATSPPKRPPASAPNKLAANQPAIHLDKLTLSVPGKAGAARRATHERASFGNVPVDGTGTFAAALAKVKLQA